MGLIGMFDRCVYGTALVRSSVDIGQQEFVEVGIDADCERTNKKIGVHSSALSGTWEGRGLKLHLLKKGARF